MIQPSRCAQEQSLDIYLSYAMKIILEQIIGTWGVQNSDCRPEMLVKKCSDETLLILNSMRI